MLFAWQGLKLRHPEEFGPAVLSGNRAAGYARLEADERRIQVRWAQAGGDARISLSRYLDLIERDAKKAKAPFEGQINDDLTYRLKAPNPARGLIRDYGDRRLILEVTGSIRLFEDVVASVEFEDGRWSLFGLDVRLPTELEMHKAELQAGRTSLTFRTKGTELEVERWGLADRLLAERSLEDWYRARLSASKAERVHDPAGVRLRLAGLNPWEAICLQDDPRNQIVCVKSTGRRLQYRPQWDWIVSSLEDHLR